jgi:GNAT superfamily N-acetyltransferase
MSATRRSRGDDIIVAEGWRPGALGAIVSLLAAYHCPRYGFGPVFETKVAREFAEFLERYDADRDRLFLALQGERVVGGMVIDGGDATAATQDARLRWFVLAEECQGRGVGGRMMDAAMRFLAERRSERCYLTTIAGLDAARALYERRGFRLVEESEAASWGAPVTEQRFEWARGR